MHPCIHKEGSDALKEWVELQQQRLYGGQVAAIIGELVRHWEATPKTGPGNKGKRERLEQIFTYLKQRTSMMNYDELIADDLEISTGQIEGAVNYVLGLRCDHGGMRWIKERAEAILQLRCIDINGDWGATRHCWSERSEVCGLHETLRSRPAGAKPARPKLSPAGR